MTEGHQHAPGPLDRALAGLQAGTIGVLGMLLWLGVCSAWRQEGFWTGPSLLASAFRPSAAFSKLELRAAFGVALYILLYGALGALFALAAGRPIAHLRLSLIAMVAGAGWYSIVYPWLWRAGLPVGALLYGGRAAVLGHLLYGALLGRFPRYLPRAATAEVTSPIAETEAPTTSPPPAD